MLDNLTNRLQKVLKTLRGEGRLTEANMQEGLREIRMALLEADVNLKVARTFVERIRAKAMGQEVLQSLSPDQHLVRILRDELQTLLGEGRAVLELKGPTPAVIMMVGLQGSGKTSTAAKLALSLKTQGRSPLLVPADVYRPAAIDQLHVLGRANQLAVFDGGDSRDSRGICREALTLARTTGRDTMIVDTAGRLHVDDVMMTEAKDLAEILAPREILSVADAMTGQDAVNSAAAFAAALPITGVVLTKLDGDTRGGAALSIKETTGVSIKLIGTGEKIEDLEPVHPDRMASRIIGMGDVLTLIEKAEAVYDEEDAEEMARSMVQGEFSLEDLREQLRKVKRMGSLSSLLEMIPGVSSLAAKAGLGQGEGAEEEGLRTTQAILDSMTREERLSPHLINSSRKKRIARGSGTRVQDVNKVLKQHAQMRRMMRAMTRRGRRGGAPPGLPFPFR